MKFIYLLLPIFLFGMPSLQEVLKYPHTYYRDFWLIQYIKKVNSPRKAEFLYSEITHKKKFHFKLLVNKYPLYKEIYDCENINKNNWMNYPESCILINGFKLNDISKMDSEEIKSLLNYISPSKIKTEIEILFNKSYFLAFNDKELFFDVYPYFEDVYIPKEFLDKVSNDKRFKYFVSFIVRSNKPKMQNSLLEINYKNLSDEVKFLLAINAVHLNKDKLAINVLTSIKNKTNKENFWLYLLTKDKKYANKLLQNRRLDFYTLYIYEEFGKKYKIDNVSVNNKSKVYYDINNPLDVIKFYQDKSKISSYKEYRDFILKLDNEKMLPLKVLILDKLNYYTKNYYIMPKYDLKDLDTDEKALFFALARQESRFIPAQISPSYAIGLMQMMPFLIRELAPNKDLEKFFKTKWNVKYAKKHLKWLDKRLPNALFIAYAYNGGIGFTKRKVMNYFKFSGKYEPFLSMELVPYTESREYGKKVLTNYIIYRNLLHKPLSLHKFIKQNKRD